MAKKEDVDLIIGTDPDADRTGIVVRDGSGEYVSLTGNQVGALLTDYIITARSEKGLLPPDGVVITSIVSTRMTFEICKRAGVAIYEVLTGFKFIGEKIKELEEAGNSSFLFAFEESYGYLAGNYSRDKDAVTASMLIAEMAAWYKQKGMTLFEALHALYAKYGWFAERTISIKMDGNDAHDKMKALMKKLRHEAPRGIGGTAVAAARDYLSGERTEFATGKISPAGQPTSDVLYFELADGCDVIVRPSGTEPKIKLYLLVRGSSEAGANELLDQYETGFRSFMD
jgi:phosphoglucomutase